MAPDGALNYSLCTHVHPKKGAEFGEYCQLNVHCLNCLCWNPSASSLDAATQTVLLARVCCLTIRAYQLISHRVRLRILPLDTSPGSYNDVSHFRNIQ